MEIWLDSFRIPVLPSSYEVSKGGNNEEVVINAMGTINLLGKRGLTSISFSSFFPKKKESYCEYSNFPSPKECVAKLDKLKLNGVCKLVMTGSGINLPVTIETFSHSENDGTGDVSYALELKEYRYLTAPVIKKKASVKGATRQTASATKTIQYTVKSGDNLTKIALAKTGSSNWKPIYNDNKSIIGSNPNKIYPNQVLTIKNAKG